MNGETKRVGWAVFLALAMIGRTGWAQDSGRKADPPGPAAPSGSGGPASAPADSPAGSGAGAEEASTALPRETPVENPLGRAGAIAGSAFGGYGEMTLNVPAGAPSVLDLRRLVLFFGHDFSPTLRFYSEIELEHAVSSASDKGEIEVEQAFLDGLFDRKINLRGGLIILPVGIVNVYHEPPSFNGVDRPDVDQLIIPTTWREPGVGIFGELAEGLRYQLYVVDGLNANGFSAASAVREGHQEAQLASAGDFGAVARLDYEPSLGTVFGASAYAATSGNTLRGAVGRVPVSLVEADFRTRWRGWTARAEAAMLFLGNAGALDRALASGTPDQQAAGPVASRAQGGYVEIGYDLLRIFAPASTQSLTLFGRFDYADTQADVPAGFAPKLEFRRTSEVLGLVHRPIPQIALKADVRHRQFGAGGGFNEVAAAITWLF